MSRLVEVLLVFLITVIMGGSLWFGACLLYPLHIIVRIFLAAVGTIVIVLGVVVTAPEVKRILR